MPKANGVMLPCSREYQVKRSDVHRPGSGRTLAGTMTKTTVASKYHLELKYAAIPFQDAVQTLQATGSEFFSVTFLGVFGRMETRTFYRGDVSCRFLGHGLDRYDVEFNLIER